MTTTPGVRKAMYDVALQPDDRLDQRADDVIRLAQERAQVAVGDLGGVGERGAHRIFSLFSASA
jgi:DUF1680 family protein